MRQPESILPLNTSSWQYITQPSSIQSCFRIRTPFPPSCTCNGPRHERLPYLQRNPHRLVNGSSFQCFLLAFCSLRRLGYPIPGQTTVYDTIHTIDLENAPLNGGFLLKTLVLSIDPYMRGRMRDASIKSYVVSEPCRPYDLLADLGDVVDSQPSSWESRRHFPVFSMPRGT